MRALSILAASALALGIFAGANSADAGCKRFGFTVNDYGKEGPTNDAKALLDKHVTKWAAENGITNYRVGKKDVKCELFLDFVVFDEYTCTASANVCWGGDMSKIAPSEDVATDGEKPPAPVSKVAAGLKREKPAEAAAQAEASGAAAEPPKTAEAVAPPAETPASEEAAAPVEQAAQEAAPPAMEPPAATAAATAPAPVADETPQVSVSSGTPVVETGALGSAGMPDASAPADHNKMATTSDDDQSAAASSAAAAAAAAAERAAAAAETAAAAAKEAAAAAVAASAANRGVIVPPIETTR